MINKKVLQYTLLFFSVSYLVRKHIIIQMYNFVSGQKNTFSNTFF